MYIYIIGQYSAQLILLPHIYYRSALVHNSFCCHTYIVGQYWCTIHAVATHILSVSTGAQAILLPHIYCRSVLVHNSCYCHTCICHTCSCQTYIDGQYWYTTHAFMILTLMTEEETMEQNLCKTFQYISCPTLLPN